MDDAEAEAVMLALGGVLKWEAMEDAPFLKDELWIGRHADADRYERYFVHKEESVQGNVVLGYTARQRYPSSDSDATYPTATTAKLACERHNATGEWE